MPTFSTVATVSTTKEIKLTPVLTRKLLTELRTYAELKDHIKTLEYAADKHKATIGKLREETGEQSVSLEGFTVTLVAGTRKKFNPKKFVSLGGEIEIYNQAIDEVPTKPYEKVTCPHSPDEEE